MAIRFAVSGDRFASRAGTIIPKTFATATYAAAVFVPTSEQNITSPAVGHLVSQDVSIDDGVKRAVLNAPPYGLIESINSSDGFPSVIKLVKAFSLVFELLKGSAPVRGNSIQANGSVGSATSSPVGVLIGGVYRDQVKEVAPGAGVGIIVAYDTVIANSQYLVRVEFGS